MKIYSIRDSKSGRFSQPVVAEDDFSAKRIFLSFAISNQFWKDFELFCVGSFYPTYDDYDSAYPLAEPDSGDVALYSPVHGCFPLLINVSEDEVEVARRDYAEMVKGAKK